MILKKPAVALADQVSPRLLNEARWLRSRPTNSLYRTVEHLVTPGSVVVDIGASIGTFSARLVRLVGRTGCVHAFEPNPVSGADLHRIRSSRLIIHDVALSSASGETMLRVPVQGGQQQAGLGSINPGPVDAETATYRVPSARLAGVLADVDRLDFIKCDVEGHEGEVLEGGMPLLERFHPSVLIEIEQRHRDDDIGGTFELFEKLGYDGWAVFPEGLRPISDFSIERDQLQILTSCDPSNLPAEYVHNFLFVPAGASVDALLDSR